MLHPSSSKILAESLTPASPTSSASKNLQPVFPRLVLPSFFDTPTSPSYTRHVLSYLTDFVVDSAHVWLEGFQIYAVEQWIVDRTKPVTTIAVFTGDPQDQIQVDILIPSPDIRDPIIAWNKATARLRADGARPIDTKHGVLHVTSLSNFRNDLSIVLIPGGSLVDVLDRLFVNINLRRLGRGGRSGLSLHEPSSAQQDAFLHSFRLQNPQPNIQAFNHVLLSLINLVQSALALFGLGPCAKRTANIFLDVSTADSLYSSPVGSPVQSRSQSVEESKPQSFVPDGLLCEETVDALTMWQVDIGVPIFHLDASDSILAPSVLASLLSLVITLRVKMEALGSHGIPKDPFRYQDEFLKAYRTTLSSLSRDANNVLPDYLSHDGIALIKTTYESKQGTSRARRVIKTTLDLPGAIGSSLAAESSHAKAQSLDEETPNLETFIASIQKGPGAEARSVRALWYQKRSKKKKNVQTESGSEKAGGAESKQADGSNNNNHHHHHHLHKHHHRSKRKQNKQGSMFGSVDFDKDIPGSGRVTPQESTSTGTEGEQQSLPLQLLKEVSSRAGKAGRKLGDGVSGLLEKTNDNQLSKLGSYRHNRSESLGIEGITRHLRPTRSSQVDLNAGECESPSMPVSDLRRFELMNTPKTRNRRAATMSGLGPPQLPFLQGGSRPGGLTIYHKGSVDHNIESSILEESFLEEPSTSKERRKVVSSTEGPIPFAGLNNDEKSRLARFRSKSFNCMADLPSTEKVYSRARLRAEFDLYYTYLQLLIREREMSSHVLALQELNEAYILAIKQVKPVVEKCAEEVEWLMRRGKGTLESIVSLENVEDVYKGIEGLAYAGDVLHEKVEETWLFKTMLETRLDDEKIGIQAGVEQLKKRGSQAGMMRLVEHVEFWREWLRYLWGRGLWFAGLGGRAGGISADEAKVHRERLNARRQSVPSVSQMLGGAATSGIKRRKHAIEGNEDGEPEEEDKEVGVEEEEEEEEEGEGEVTGEGEENGEDDFSTVSGLREELDAL